MAFERTLTFRGMDNVWIENSDLDPKYKRRGIGGHGGALRGGT